MQRVLLGLASWMKMKASSVRGRQRGEGRYYFADHTNPHNPSLQDVPRSTTSPRRFEMRIKGRQKVAFVAMGWDGDQKVAYAVPVKGVRKFLRCQPRELAVPPHRRRATPQQLVTCHGTEKQPTSRTRTRHCREPAGLSSRDDDDCLPRQLCRGDPPT